MPWGWTTTTRVPRTLGWFVNSAVIVASPFAVGLAAASPELLTPNTVVFELRHLRFGRVVADLVVPSAWRTLARN